MAFLLTKNTCIKNMDILSHEQFPHIILNGLFIPMNFSPFWLFVYRSWEKTPKYNRNAIYQSYKNRWKTYTPCCKNWSLLSQVWTQDLLHGRIWWKMAYHFQCLAIGCWKQLCQDWWTRDEEYKSLAWLWNCPQHPPWLQTPTCCCRILFWIWGNI